MDSADVAEIVAPQKRGNHPRNTVGLREAQRDQRTPHKRIGLALGAMFGEHTKEVAHCVGAGVRSGVIPPGMATKLLDAVLPSQRPVMLDLPEIVGPAELLEAERKISRALNAGQISPDEMLKLQKGVRHAWRSRRLAMAEMGR